MIPRLPSFLSFLFRRSLPNDYLTIQLERACREDICPICIFEGESRYTWLWSFLWEHVNDPEARDQFISAGGLCPADLWRAVELARHVIKSSLGVAMVFQHLIKIITRALETGRSSAPWISSSPWRFDLGSGCQACATAESAARVFSNSAAPRRLGSHPTAAGLSRPSSCAAAIFRAWYPRPPAQSPALPPIQLPRLRRRKPKVRLVPPAAWKPRLSLFQPSSRCPSSPRACTRRHRKGVPCASA